MNKLTRTISVVVIIAATFLVYWPALRNGFVWDDTALVLRDPLIRSWYLMPLAFRHYLFTDATASSFFRPMQRLSFTADYQLYGFTEPQGWHFTSILIHACAASALFYVAEKLLAMIAATRLSQSSRLGIALSVALLWAIHPLHTSAVTYISGRADPLAALFGFIGLGLGLGSRQPRGRPRVWVTGAAAAFALALFSKESGIAFLVIWLLVLLWRRESWRVFAGWSVTFALIIAGYCALRFTSEREVPPPPQAVPALVRPILAARAFAEYASLIVAPVTLRMERDVSTTPRDTVEATFQNARLREYQTLAGVLLLIGFAAWARHCVRSSPVTAFCLGAFAVAYLPVSNLFSLNATIAEHWLYVPSAFLFLAAALTITKALTPEDSARHRRMLDWIILICGIWMALLGARTFLRQEDWRDQRTFIERTIVAGGGSARMYMNLANVESNAGNQEHAVALYHEALRRAPEQPVIWLGFASVLVRAHDFDGARAALEHSEKSPMLVAESLELLAVLDHVESGTDSGESLRDAMDFEPDNWLIRKHYIEYLIERRNYEEAVRELRDFVEAHRFRAETWRTLGALLEAMENRPLAIDAYRQAVLRDVHDEESRAGLARLRGK